MSQNQDQPQNQQTVVVGQPAQNWDQAQTQQPQNVQYVVMQKSYQGVSGWLMFFVVVFGLNAMSYVSIFFVGIASLISSGATGGAVLNAIFGLPLAALSVVALVFICLQKKLGRVLAFASLAALAFYTFLGNVITVATAGGSGAEIVANVGGIFGGLIGYGLIALYFVISKRVKATLIK